MDYLWTPWRYQYMKGAMAGTLPECIFCDAAMDDKCGGVGSFIILNRYPYTGGHLMIVPYKHTDELAALDSATLTEMMQLAQRTETVFKSLYKPEGINFGMNLGRAAGAGVLGHLHLHALPRWAGDSNFMTVVAETRVLPEELHTTYERLRAAFS